MAPYKNMALKYCCSTKSELATKNRCITEANEVQNIIVAIKSPIDQNYFLWNVKRVYVSEYCFPTKNSKPKK